MTERARLARDLGHISDALESWVDWEQRDGDVADGKHITTPPIWPTVGQIKLWVATLRQAKSELS